MIHTHFFDDFLLDACGRLGTRQVVLAAGLDNRAFRLDWPPLVCLFDMDLPELLDAKEGVIEEAGASCERRTDKVDLRQEA